MSEAKNEVQPQSGDLERVVITPEMVDLVRFLAATWDDIDRFVYEHCDAEALAQYPVIQGTRNQFNIRRIGMQEYKPENVRKAVDWLLAL
jgi:hypothetical protein